MRIERPDRGAPKGWYFGPWNSESEISVGYANEAINEPHLHHRTTEVFLVAQGEGDIVVDGASHRVRTGDAILISPGEAHTWTWGSPDFFCFVLHHPAIPGDKTLAEEHSTDRTTPHRMWPQPPWE